ncbi:transcriptional activator NhaR [Azohydromonas caseinilytica]|uniref:Transcriptional activator NhaR n=1 Tax=Azohydromonas caseinilytica TaxID=2728836 RepID=A0A848FGR8_9BURK|nr:transcriptional activator NhaR [Azohydromonas caseinilytica]NML18336.1 transcriptional activator NhaR [Azohydromonas caseinilytica]
MNYKHLHYFLQVAEAGSVARASELLHLTPQTVSGQIQLLEERLGSPLFARSGRRLVLTDTGRMVLDYAKDIFAMGAELEAAVREGTTRGRALEFRVGVADAVPKAVAYHLVEPAFAVQDVRIVCREWKLDLLLAELALHKLDLVISDAPIPSSVSVKAFSHRLGASTLSFFGTAALRERHPGDFPACLDAAPVLMQGEDSAVGQRLRAWFQSQGVRPRVVGEFDDSALIQEFGRRSAGFFAAPDVLADEVQTQFGVQAIGVAEGVEEDFFAISVERRITHPCVVAITQTARNELFQMADKAPRAGPARRRAMA